MYCLNKKQFSIISIVFSFICIFVLSGFAYSAEVTVFWDNPYDIRIKGYNIYCGKSGTDITSNLVQVINSADQTNCTFSGLEEGQIYGFVATCFDADGNESDFPDVFYYSVPVTVVDSDGDGLTDEEEVNIYGTDPNAADSDNDGIDDFQELIYWEDNWLADYDSDGIINLLDPDSDNDGVSDGTEISQGLKPDDPSDNDSEDSTGGQVIVDNGGTGTYWSGSWPESGGASYYESVSVYSNEVGATYTFEAAVNGSYEVSLWWTEWASRDTSVPVEIYDGGVLLDTLYVDQQVDGGQWNVQGIYEFRGTARIVIVSDSGYSTCADAVKFAPLSEVIVDNGGPGSSLTGNWPESGGTLSYESTSVYSKEVGATYTFETSVSGDYEVSLWWTEYSSRSASVPVEIYDGTQLLDTVYLNQQIGGGQWNVQGTYSFTGVGRVVIISDSTNYSTCADAVRFVSKNSNSDTTEIDQDNDGYTVAQGDCNDSDASVYPDAVEICGDGIDQDCNGSDLECAPDPSDVDDDGDGYTENESDCNDADASVHPDATEICGDGIDQNCDGFDPLCPEDIDNDGDGYTENEGDCNDGNASVYPEAIEICGDGIDQDCNGSDLECLPDPLDVDDDADGYAENEGDCNDNDASIYPGAIEICGDGIDQDCNGNDLECLPLEIIVDNGGTGTYWSGSWPESGGTSYYENISVYSNEVGATYTFETAVNGVYEVSLWWTEWASRDTSVPVEIYDGGVLLDTVYVNQQVDGGQWNVQGTYEFTGMARIVIVSDSGYSTCADAVRLVPETLPEPVPAPEIVLDNGGNGTLSEGSWRDSGGDQYYGSVSEYSKKIGDIYTFETPLNGTHEVSLWWTEWPSRSASVPVEIYDGGILLDTVYVNQQINGGRWNIQGTYNFNGIARVLIISESKIDTTCADAVKFFPVGNSGY